MFLVLALLIGMIGALPILLSKESGGTKLVVSLIATICYTLIGWWIIWGGLPHIASPLYGSYSILLLFWWIISFVIVMSISEFEWSHAFWFPFTLLLLYIFVAISGAEIFNADRYSTLIGKIDGKTKQHWSKEIQPLDPTHIRLVPEELAISLAKTSLSQDGSTLGSQYPLTTDYITLQKIKNDYWYLIPLDFEGFTVWTKNNSIVPGYVKVSATDPYAKPILISNKKIKYTPNAYFSENLDRHIYWKYINYRLTDYSFEENDSNQIYWVITVMKPTISFWGNKVEGVILVNPETGEDEFISVDKLQDKKYAWIDRVIPESIISDYINYWGSLKDGWWNEFWTHVNLLKSETPTMNYSSDGKCIFVSPVTSTSHKDESMTGLMYIDAKTGKFTYYTTSGGATEDALIKAVNSSISYKKYSA